MRFEEAYERWNVGRLTQAEAAQLLGLCERSFRRYVVRYEAEGLAGLADRRLEQVSQRRAPVDEVLAVTDRYQRQHLGWMCGTSTAGTGAMAASAATAGSSSGCKRRGWWPRARRRGCTGGSGNARRCRGCCCTRTAAGMSGWWGSNGT